MPVASQVKQNGNSALTSVEGGLAVIACSSEPLPGPEIENAAPHKWTRRAAWSGLIRIVCFFCLIVVLMLALNATIDAGLRRIKTSQFGVSNKIVQGEINAEILISGSSRALTHYDPRIIERTTGHSTFNIGLNGSQADMQLARLKAYLRHNQKPKLLVQNLDLFSFATSHEIYDPSQYVPYLKEDSIYAGVRRVYPDAWKWKYLPLYGYAVEDMRFNWMIGLKALAGIQPREDHADGYQPRDTPWTGDFEKYRDANPNGVTVETEAQGERDFEDLISLCAQQGVPALIVYSPEYYEMQTLERNRAEIIGKAKEIARRFRVPLWDFSESPICRDRSKFYNSQHLNRNGASAFSEEFAKQLVEKGLIDRRKPVAGTPAAINTISHEDLLQPMIPLTPAWKACRAATFFFFSVLLPAGPVTAQIIPDDRTAPWQGNVGIPGGIPNRTTIWKNIVTDLGADPTGASDCSTIISNAINSCPSGQVVYIPAGTFRLDNSVVIPFKNNYTVRGAGQGVTTIKPYGTQGSFGIGHVPWPPPNTPIPITAGATKASNTITVADTSTFVVDAVMDIATAQMPVWAHNLGGFPDSMSTVRYTFKVRSKTSTTVTFDPPLPFDFSGMNPVAYADSSPMVQGVGFESFTVDMINSTVDSAFNANQAWGCWIKDVEIKSPYTRYTILSEVVRCEVRHSYFHDSQAQGPNHEGLDFVMSTGNLVEDNIFSNAGAMAVIFGDGTGKCISNVIAYNYIVNVPGWWDISVNHGPHDMLNLIEGNVFHWYKDDGYFGSSSHNTIFRNRIDWEISLKHFSNYYNVVGNVLGTSGLNTVYESSLNNVYESSIYELGYPNIGNQGWTGTFGPTSPPDYSGLPNTLDGCQQRDLNVSATILRHGNWDVIHNGIVWDPSIFDHTIPDSLYLVSKPSYFGNLTWPPIDPASPSTALPESIPAGYRYIHHTDPPGGGDGPGAPQNLRVD